MLIMKMGEKLAFLLFQHGDTYSECKGCEICDKISKVANSKKPVEVVYLDIFSKGADMSFKEIKFLLDKGINKEKLRKQVEFSHADFKDLLATLGMYKPQKKDAIKPEDIIQLRGEGVTWKAIAKKYDVTATYLMKLRRDMGVEKVKYTKKDQLKENKKPSGKKRNDFSPETKNQINELQGSSCYVCESPQVQYHHVKYRSRCGRGVKRNGLPLCNFHHNDHTYGIHFNSKFRKQVTEMFLERFGSDYYKDEYDLYKENKIAEPTKELLEEYFKKEGFE